MASSWYKPTKVKDDSFSTIFASTAAKANIFWTNGDNTADDLVNGPLTASEAKFSAAQTTAFRKGDPPLEHTFTAFPKPTKLGPGVYGSIALTTGVGVSRVEEDPTSAVSVPHFSANWTVVATGILGTTPGAHYDAYAKGVDPWSLTAAELSSLPDTTYDLWIPFQIGGGNSIGTGPGYSSSFGFSVDYATALGSSHLLGIEASGDQVTLTGDNLPNLSLYTINDVTAAPQLDPGNLITFNQLHNALVSDLTGDYSLDSPISLGFLLRGIPVPTIDMGDGSLAQISADAHAHEAAATPEPGSVTLASVVSIGLLAIRRRRNRQGRR